MTYDGLLNLTCSVMRNTPMETDAHNRPIENWVTIYAAIPCRYSAAGGREVAVDGGLVMASAVLYVGAAVDVTEKDRIVLHDATLDVETVEPIYSATAKIGQKLLVKALR